MPPRVEIRVLTPSLPYESPYVSDARGFHSGWWDGLSSALNRGMQSLTFTVEDIEVARARVYDPAMIAAEYEDFDQRLRGVEIYRFETNQSTRCRGYGRASVNLIRAQWPTRQVVAYSFKEAAYRFWSKVGFVELARQDGEFGHDPFFVAPPLD